jgi:hypothetical protein
MQGLQLSRDSAAKKPVALDRTITRVEQVATDPTNLGIPTVTSARRHLFVQSCVLAEQERDNY